MGEQSATQLRGDSMEDVIFNGCPSAEAARPRRGPPHLQERPRHPADRSSARSRCRAACSRSGMSEYFLNKAPCRLKDIRDLFFDTGMGSHAYSVIERAMVDHVLSDNSGHRRFLFEEASGITQVQGAQEGGAEQARRHRGRPHARSTTSCSSSSASCARSRARSARRAVTSALRDDIRDLDLRAHRRAACSALQARRVEATDQLAGGGGAPRGRDRDTRPASRPRLNDQKLALLELERELTDRAGRPSRPRGGSHAGRAPDRAAARSAPRVWRGAPRRRRPRRRACASVCRGGRGASDEARTRRGRRSAWQRRRGRSAGRARARARGRRDRAARARSVDRPGSQAASARPVLDRGARSVALRADPRAPRARWSSVARARARRLSRWSGARRISSARTGALAAGGRAAPSSRPSSTRRAARSAASTRGIGEHWRRAREQRRVGAVAKRARVGGGRVAAQHAARAEAQLRRRFGGREVRCSTTASRLRPGLLGVDRGRARGAVASLDALEASLGEAAAFVLVEDARRSSRARRDGCARSAAGRATLVDLSALGRRRRCPRCPTIRACVGRASDLVRCGRRISRWSSACSAR